MNSEGRLVIAATPIGNLGDITLRVLDALQECDDIFCEDTRVTQKLLTLLGKKRDSNTLHRLDESMLSRGGEQAVLELLSLGRDVCYVSDAGMPGISDPGLRLVCAARDAGYPVEVLPGASASTCAIVSSGIVADAFYFGGFLPRKQSDATKLLNSLSNLDAALVFFESPKRIASSILVISSVFPTRELAVCRELTKMHEEVIRGTASDVANIISNDGYEARGEFVLVIGPVSEQEKTSAEKEKFLHAEKLAKSIAALTDNITDSRALCEILQQTCGISRNDAYKIVHL